MNASTSPLPLSNAAARNILLQLQGLTRPPQRRLPPQDLLELITGLGFVQVDSIQWVERAHHMILHARCQSYRPKHLTRLIERERVLFEHWTHDASIIPVEFYPYWRRRFDRVADTLRTKMAQWQGEGFVDHLDSLLERIEQDGAVRSRELERPAEQRKQDMWQWHDGKAALEYLWHTGRLCVAARDGFQKVYDLAERVIPQELRDGPVPSHDAFVDWACNSAMERLGFGSAKDVAGFWDLVSLNEARDWLERQPLSRIARVAVSPVQREAPAKLLYARADIEAVLAGLDKPPARLRILSPFDPLIRNRNRLSWLFGFDYRIEIYVPEAKRKYGYYIFPMLDGDRLIGRIDVRALRSEDRLHVQRFWLERGVRWSTAKKGRLDKELARQARLCGASSVTWEGIPEPVSG